MPNPQNRQDGQSCNSSPIKEEYGDAGEDVVGEEDEEGMMSGAAKERELQCLRNRLEEQLRSLTQSVFEEDRLFLRVYTFLAGHAPQRFFGEVCALKKSLLVK